MLSLHAYLSRYYQITQLFANRGATADMEHIGTHAERLMSAVASKITNYSNVFQLLAQAKNTKTIKVLH